MSIVRNKIFSTNTAEYTVVDLKQEMMECVNILINLGYEVHIPAAISINNRLKSTHGRCCRQYNVYQIEINGNYLKIAKPQSIHDVIMHECIHCVKGCFNHGPKWKEVGAKIMKIYPQYGISRCRSDENYSEFLKEASPYRYQVICQNCGRKLNKYKKWSKTLESIYWAENRYRCGSCKSNNLVVVDL